MAHSMILLALALSFLLSSSAKHGYSSTRQRHHQHQHRHQSHTNPSLQRAYAGLQAWKKVMYSDPNNITADWNGPSVCSYTRVYCASSPNNTKIQVVAGIDLNHADIAGFLPEELGLISDLTLLHLNSNRFCGILPQSLANLTHLFELDLSNNRFVGPFPSVVLSLPNLRFLDIRFNEFEGPLPPELFSMNLDAVFVNNNWLTSVIPSNLGSTSASVVVFAHNKFEGCLPPSISSFADTMEELVLINTSLSGCLPYEVGYLYKLRLLDVSSNNLVGPIPYSLAGLEHLELLNLDHNEFAGNVHAGVCVLPNLSNFTYSDNYFREEEGVCVNLTARGVVSDDSRNCLPKKTLQRSKKECSAVYQHPVRCLDYHCGASHPIAPAPVPVASPTSG